jgi:hypothetical protein
MESDASTSPRRRSTSCYSDSGDSSCSEPFSECGSDDLSFTPAAGIHRLLLSCASEASEDAISSLVAELERPSPSLDSLRRAAMELRLLAKHNPDNRVRIAAAGGVRPLVRLLAHADPLLQEHGVTALLNLSLCDENKATIIEAGAIRPLVRALKSAASPAARENAACALLRLSQLDGASAAAIGRAGALPLLVSLLETGGARGKKDAATALYALCSGARENRQRAVEAGAVRPLLDLMADPESGMVDKAAYVLHSLLGSGDGRAAAVEEGGIPVLVEMVEVGTSRQKEIATLCLLQICEDNAVYRTMVAREGAIPPLVALSQSSSARTKLKTKVHTPPPPPRLALFPAFNRNIRSIRPSQLNSQTNALPVFSPDCAGGVAGRDAAAAAEPEPPRSTSGGGCGGVTAPFPIIPPLLFFGETSRRRSSGRPACACKYRAQRVCVRQRVYSFLKRDVVRRIEEVSSLLVISSTQTLHLLPFHLHFPPTLVASSPPAAAWRRVVCVCVCSETSKKCFEFACARVGWALSQQCVRVRATSGNQLGFPILWWRPQTSKKKATYSLFCSRVGWGGPATATAIGIG